MEIFAERLKELRIKNILTQVQLAEYISVSQSAIKHWENNQRVPNAEAVVTLAEFFRVSTDYLLGVSDD